MPKKEKLASQDSFSAIVSEGTLFTFTEAFVRLSAVSCEKYFYKIDISFCHWKVKDLEQLTCRTWFVLISVM